MKPWDGPGFEDTDGLVSAYDDLPLWSAPFGLSLLDTVRMRDVKALLDVGCGTGFPLIELAERLGPTVRAVGLEPWHRAAARASKKALERTAINVALVRARAEAMPFPDGAFDLIVSNNGLNNTQDLIQALAECGRVARPGAQLVVTANLPDSFRELYEVYAMVLAERGLSEVIPRVRAHIYALRQPVGALRKWIEKAGFADVKVQESEFRLRFADGTALFEHWFVRIAFLKPWVSILPPPEVDAVFSTLVDRLDREAAARGSLTLTVPFACFDATRSHEL